MAEQHRGPNLEELDDQQAHRFLTDMFFAGLSPDVVYQANHPDDYMMEMPQSSERIRGRENMRSFHEAYPNTPSIRLRRVWSRTGFGWLRGSTTTAAGKRPTSR
jgi:hypothetical protein